jgi:hypothetical protein
VTIKGLGAAMAVGGYNPHKRGISVSLNFLKSSGWMERGPIQFASGADSQFTFRVWPAGDE